MHFYINFDEWLDAQQRTRRCRKELEGTVVDQSCTSICSCIKIKKGRITISVEVVVWVVGLLD